MYNENGAITDCEFDYEKGRYNVALNYTCQICESKDFEIASIEIELTEVLDVNKDYLEVTDRYLTNKIREHIDFQCYQGGKFTDIIEKDIINNTYDKRDEY